MRLDNNLRLEVTQKLIMTPQLLQAIAILQLSSLELAGMVEQALLENPVLEAEEKENIETEGQEVKKADELLNEYFDWAEYFNDGTDTGYMPTNLKDIPSFEAFTASEISLQEHLELQLHLAVFGKVAATAGKYLIGCIDDNGYLRCTVSEAAQTLNMDEDIINGVLAVIQTFEPAGVGARNLQECLNIQARQRGITDSRVTAIIDYYLAEVASGRYKVIADKLGCTIHEVQQAVDVIRSLDPKPGRGFGSSQSGYIVPDITVERINSKYFIIVNDTTAPRLVINPYYRQVARGADSDARKYVEEHLNSAVWLIKSIEQRRRTLYNIMEAIIQLQPEFFDISPKFLRPLTMKKVAEHINVHESTVSRAIANKYANTPQGLFSLRDFFSGSIHGMDGEDVAAARVKREIKELVAKEDAAHPLSDQALSDVLNRQGITVSRRTVAKYREEMGIASSAKRKRY